MAGLKFALVILLSVWNWSKAVEGGYLITTPRVYRTGSEQRLNVDLYGDNALWNITAFLKISRNNEIISSSTGKLFKGGSRGTMNIKVPPSVSVRYNVFNNIYLQVHGVAKGKPEFWSKQALTLDKQEDTIFIQTDKPIYKPGQTVRLRVIGINPDLKPLPGKVERISISKPKEVRMMQWDDVEFRNGIASVSMVLSKYPVLGEWKIQARYKGNQVHKTVEVAKYVLPKFEVVIRPPPFIVVDRKVVSGFICARYTYDRVVFGRLRATFNLNGQQKATIDTKIQGCYAFSLNSKELGLENLKNSFRQEVLSISANVTEDVTGITSSSNSETKIEQYRVKLNFNIGTSKHFKPGLPFFGQLQVTTPDRKPVNNENITITAHDEKRKKLFKNPFRAMNGIINFKIPDVPLQVKKLYLKAEHSSGIAHSTAHNFECLPWYSPSSSFLTLEKLSGPIQVGGSVEINFMFIDKENVTNFNLQLICGGNMVVSEERRIPVRQIKPRIARGSIKFEVTQDMVPSCRLLVYYIRKDGETVADSMVVDVEDKLENQVVVRFSDDVCRPGEPVQITMTATPGSTVALAGVDKSVHLLRQAQDLETQQVVEVLTSNDVGPTDRYKRKKKCYKDQGYVDSSKAFYDSGLIYLSDSEIESRPCPTFPPPTDPPAPVIPYWQYGCLGMNWRWRCCIRFGRRKRRSICPSNVLRECLRQRSSGVRSRPLLMAKAQERRRTNPVLKSPRIISETWLWSEEIISNTSNQKTIKAIVPDTITSWYFSAFAMSSRTGMGVAKPSTLTVFQPFFVSFTLPYSVIRGEEVSVIATVFNYMDKCATVRIRLTKTDHFQLNSTADPKLCVCGNEAKSVKYVITPVQLGHIPLTVTVQNVAPSLCENPSDEARLGISDAVIRKLLVEPEGVQQEYTYNNFICSPDNAKLFAEMYMLKISLPKQIVPGSVHATVSVIGDLMGPSLTGLEELLRLPTGCGEQNMVKFAPNIFIMQYLNSTNQLTNDIKTKAEGFLRTGYQREMTFKREDGSYSAFGDSDKEGSLWLTAFVLKSFSQARQFIFIDDKELEGTIKWIESKQLETGCFRKYGNLFFKELKGGVSTPVTLTAYVLIALLESKVNPKSGVILKALKCITTQKDSVTDAYSNAIIAYALTLVKHPSRGEFLKRLKSQATFKWGQMYWEKKEKTKKQAPFRPAWTPPYQRSSSINIEMTSYALMAMIGDGTDSNAIAESMPIVQWITKQRNELGGFSSTQDTCVALQALSRYASHVYREGTSMRIDVGSLSNSPFQHSFSIYDHNRLVLQKVEIPSKNLPMENIPIVVGGQGCALAQVNVQYNIPDVDKTPAFKLSASVQHQKRRFSTRKTEAGEVLCQPLEVNVCAKWLEDDKSGMAIIDVKMVSGFVPDEESLERLLNRFDLNLMKFEIQENKVVLYFDEIEETCFSFGILQTSVVKKTKPVAVTVYEYYDTDKSATTMYKITKELCERNVDPCPLCPTKLDANALQSTLCTNNYVLSIQTTLPNGLRSLEFLVGRQELNSTKAYERKDFYGVYDVPLPKGCRCAALHGTGARAYVLLKKKPDVVVDKKLKRLDLDENATVLDRREVSLSSLALASTKCY